jgi:hypothetical protein
MQDYIELVALDDVVEYTWHSDIRDDRKLELARVDCGREFVAQIGCLALCSDSRGDCMPALQKSDDDVHSEETVAASEKNVARHVEANVVYEAMRS